MSQFFVKDYTGAPFELFGLAHLVALALVVLVNLIVIINRKRFTPRGKLIFRNGLAAVLVVNELAWHLWNYSIGQWTIQTMLPLHMCSVFVWLTAYMLYTRNYQIYELAYFLGVGGAMQALITPDAGPYGFPHYRAIQTFFAHGLLVIVPIYMTVVEGFRPTLASLKRVFIWTNIYMVPVFFLNLAIGSNYLFIAHKPEFPTILDALSPWPWSPAW